MSQSESSVDEATEDVKDETSSTPKNFSPLRIPEISIPAGSEETKPQIVSHEYFKWNVC